MTNTKWTPGPWYVSKSIDYFKDGATVIRRGNPTSGLVVAVITKTEEEKDNARLIAAAPEMAECLKMLLDAIDGNHLTVGDCNEARHILARIQGDA